MKKKSILYFGSFDPQYARNRIIKKGLISNGFNVLENQAGGIIFSRYLKLGVKFLKYRKDIGSIIVGFPGHFDVPLAFVLGRLFGKKVFYDIFASTYETYVLDRGVVQKNSIKSKFYFFVDWIGLKLADYVIVDTKAHGKFYNQLYGVAKKKQIVVYVGSDTDYFYPRKLKEETDVLFYGSYQPLQGVETIIKAAGKLPNIHFKMIGNGQTRKSAEEVAKNLRLKNVEFVNWVPLEVLAEEISKAKICLGIFGNSQKANVVIPNKIYDYIATAKAIITKDTEAIEEIQNPGIFTVKGDGISLSLVVKKLYNQTSLREKAARENLNYFKKKLNQKTIVKPLIEIMAK